MAKMKLEKNVQITLIIVGAVILLAVGAAIYFKSNSIDNTITVNGQATAEVSPDLITVYFNVQTKGATSKEANDANTLIVNKLTANLVALGFSESDLTTESYNTYQEYDYTNGQKFLDWITSTSLKIKIPVSQKSKTSSVVDAGTNAGAGISYINFELTPALQQSAKADAIRNASTDARTKAEALAAGFNKNLGKLVSVSLDEFNYRPWPVYASADSSGGAVSSAPAAKSAATNINPSSQEVSASVTAVYKLV
jgi:uncharacterized protein YggE